MMLAAACCVLSACESTSDLLPKQKTIIDVRAAYDAGDYEAAYRDGARLAGGSGTPENQEAAYLAALSALQLGKQREAVRLLKIAETSKDFQLVHDAKFQRGLVHGQLGEQETAARVLLDVAPYLRGERRADAYFHAGMSLRELDRQEAAGTALILARNTAVNETQYRRAVEALQTTGFTLQLGVYDDLERARTHARAVADKAEASGYGSPRIVTGGGGEGDIGRVQHQVCIGRFRSHWSASAARRAIGAAGALIVPIDE